MKMKLISILVLFGISGCGSYSETMKSNRTNKSEHLQFQVNRLGSVDRCFARATTDNQFNLCGILQMQMQTEMGFTVTAGQQALPRAPEEQLLDAGKTALGLGLGYKMGSKLIDGLNRPNDIITRPDPMIIDREVPVFIPTPTGP